MKVGLPLIKTALKPLTKRVLTPLGLTAAVSVVYVEIYKKVLGSGTITLIMSNKEMKDIIKIVKSLADSKNKKADFLVCYLLH